MAEDPILIPKNIDRYGEMLKPDIATKSVQSSSDCSLEPKRTWRWRRLGQHRNRARAYG
jgi:hypothetical protein